MALTSIARLRKSSSLWTVPSKNKFWVQNTIMVKMVEPGEVFGCKSMVYQDGKYISHKLKVINCEKSGEM